MSSLQSHIRLQAVHIDIAGRSSLAAHLMGSGYALMWNPGKALLLLPLKQLPLGVLADVYAGR